MRRGLRDSRLGLPWLAVRLWVGWQLLQAGWDTWGTTQGVESFLADELPFDRVLAYLVPLVELLAGAALLLGLLTVPAAIAAVLLALDGVLAGGGDPLLLALSLLLVAAGPAAYVYGVDRFVKGRLRKTRKGPQSSDRYDRPLSSGSLSGRTT